MRAGSRHIGAGLTLLSFAIAFAQRPGSNTSDTKIDLHVEPLRFLGEVASVWSSSGGLGQVQAGQYSGYLFPMGPFYALGDLAGLAPWVVHRLWLGALLAVAALGTVHLLRALSDRESPVALAVAGVLIVVNPYVATFTQVTSVTLLGYAALPWLMLAVHRGLRGHGWWWPALFALAFTATGGGVNAAVTAWLLLGPGLLLAWEWWTRAASVRAAWRLVWRTGLLTVLASLWWLVPVGVHAALGINFLPFTESAGAIWATTSIPESLRLMGYWLSYLGAGFGDRPLPYFDASNELLFSTPVVVASLLVPAIAVAGLLRSRRWSYAPFFLLLLLVGLLVMSTGFPEGTPLRRALTTTYNHFEPVQFLRTTYKAGPLVALAVACLAGAAAQAWWPRLSGPARLAVPVAAAALVAVAAWPLATGRALDEKFTWEEIPSPWRDAARDIDERIGERDRALVLPGQLYAFYDWGATIDPILPVLAKQPVSSRTAVPYADLHAVDMLWTVDSLVQQERALPGQLAPLLGWLGVGAVATGADDDPAYSGTTSAAEAARALAIGGLPPERAAAAYGEPRALAPDPASATPAAELPQVRRYDIEGSGFVRVQPREPDVLVDGSAEAIAGLAAFGAVRPGTAVAYAGDQDDGDLASLAATAREIVISDSNRRRVVSPSRPRQGDGRTLAADEPVPVDAPVLEPFADRGTGAQTVVVFDGAQGLRSPFSPGFPQFPEHRPYAAFDGDPATWWEADRELRGPNRWVELRFEAPREVPHVDVLPRREDRTAVTEVEVAGRRFEIRPGWNRLELDLPAVDRLRVRISRRDYPDDLIAGPGALAEVRVPGLRVREALRPPVRLERLTEGTAPSVTYLFRRTTGDRPFRRQPSSPADAASIPEDRAVERVLIREARDAERDLRRRISPPAGRAWSANAWVSLAADAPDAAVDALAGTGGAASFTSSGRFEGRPDFRASRAFDRDPRTGWIGRLDDAGRAWVAWRGGGPGRARSIRLEPPSPPARLPSRVRLRWAGGETPALSVPADGRVDLRRSVPLGRARIEVVEAGEPGAAVGIGEVRATGLPRGLPDAGGPIRSRCGDVVLRVAGAAIPLRVRGRAAQLGMPLRARSCGRPARLPGGETTLVARGELFAPYLLRLRSGAPPAERAPAGAVLDHGEASGGRREGVRVAPDGPARLVLAESFNRAWRASCNGRSLGEPSIADGWANGWDIEADCRDVEFSFGPESAVRIGYVLSGAACLALLLYLLLARRRASYFDQIATTRSSMGAAGILPRPLGRAAAVAIPLAALVAIAFALRAGAVAFPLLTLLLWRGASVGALIGASAMLLAVVVPALYALFPPEDMGGYNSSFAAAALGAHWVSVAAFVLLALALWRMLAVRPRAGIR